MLLAFWLAHVDMTMERTINYRYGTYKDFIREYKKYNWEMSKHSKNSYIEIKDTYRTKIDASIIMFDGKGMILYPISYIRFSINKYLNRLPKLLIEERIVDNRDISINKILNK